MTVKEAVKHLENLKWLKGYSNTTVDGVPIGNVIDGIIALLKEQEPLKPIMRHVVFENDTSSGWENKMYCPKCKMELLTRVNYCPKCGQAVKWDG